MDMGVPPVLRPSMVGEVQAVLAAVYELVVRVAEDSELLTDHQF